MGTPRLPVSKALAAIATGRPVAPLETRAYRDAMRAIARDIPDVETYARLMPLAQAEMLMAATFSGDGFKVPHHHAHLLRPFGLVEAGVGQRCLTAFAIKVRRALLEEDA